MPFRVFPSRRGGTPRFDYYQRCGTWIRTKISRFRVCCTTVIRSRSADNNKTTKIIPLRGMYYPPATAIAVAIAGRPLYDPASLPIILQIARMEIGKFTLNTLHMLKLLLQLFYAIA